MKDRINKLLTVKSIITLLFTIVVSIKAVQGEYDIESIYLMIIGFYFGTQHEKDK